MFGFIFQKVLAWAGGWFRIPFPKPKNSTGHHLVALADPRAEKALRILLAYGIDPSNEANGVNLPRYKGYTPHPNMPNAISHAETHTNNYYGHLHGIRRQLIAD